MIHKEYTCVDTRKHQAEEDPPETSEPFSPGDPRRLKGPERWELCRGSGSIGAEINAKPSSFLDGHQAAA